MGLLHRLSPDVTIDVERLKTSLSTPLDWQYNGKSGTWVKIAASASSWLDQQGHHFEIPSLPPCAEWAVYHLLSASLQGDKSLDQHLLDVVALLATGKFWLTTTLRVLLEVVELVAGRVETARDSLFVYRAMSFLLRVFEHGTYVTRIRSLYKSMSSELPNSGYLTGARLVVEKHFRGWPGNDDWVNAPKIYLEELLEKNKHWLISLTTYLLIEKGNTIVIEGIMTVRDEELMSLPLSERTHPQPDPPRFLFDPREITIVPPGRLKLESRTSNDDTVSHHISYR